MDLITKTLSTTAHNARTKMGKGSKQRPTNKATFDDNFDRIVGKPKQVCDNEQKPEQAEKVKKDAVKHKE